MKPLLDPRGNTAARPIRSPRPSLRLLPGEGRPRRHRRPFLGIAAVVVAVIVGLASLHQREVTRQDPGLTTAFTELPGIYQREGMLTFLEAKARLRLKVADALQDQDDQVSALADNIAVYLFPDLLPEADFERGPATELWLPIERAIESAPHSPQSRARYQRLEAEIWNYEAADRKIPDLSPVATGVLRIYDALSSH
jgi:hypothetical protein